MRRNGARTRGFWALAVVLVAALTAPASSARATPQDLFGFGARTPGLAMTGVSFATGWDSVYVNPAGLGAARRRAISFGAGAGVYDLRLDGERFPLEASRGTTIGFHIPLPFGDVLEDRLVLGGGFYTPAGVLLRGEVAFPEVVQWPVLNRAQAVAIQVGLGFDFHGILDGLRLGVGISALANVVGDLEVRLDEANAFISTVETQLLATFSPIAGLQFEQPGWGLGLVYRHEVRAEMDLHIVVSDLPVPLPVVDVSGLIQYDPPQLALEAFWRPDPNVRIVLNGTARFWSAFPGPYRPTTTNSLIAPAPEFTDTVSPRLAIEGTLRDGRLTAMLRGGYALEMSPSPPARLGAVREADGSPHLDDDGDPVTRPLRFVDNDRHVVTAGLGVTYEFSGTEVLTFDLYGQMHALVDRTHLVPRDSAVPDPTYVGNMHSGGFVWVAGWQLGLEF